MFNNLLNRTQEFLINKLPDMPPSMQEDYSKGRLNFSDSVYFIRYEVTDGANIVDLLHNDDAIVNGICNIARQKIKQGCSIMVDRITARAAYCAKGGTETVANVEYKPIADIASVCPAFANSELELDIAQLNTVQVPISAFCQESEGVNGSKDGFILTAPKLITDSQELMLRLRVPNGTTIDGTTNRFFIEIALRGSEIRVK